MLIVARYKEDVSWAEPFHHIVLDKSGEVVRGDGVALPNVGREGHSYLYYIVENYDDLPGGMVFTQGDPRDHVGDFEAFLGRVANLLGQKPDAYIPLSTMSNEIVGMFDAWDNKMPLREYWTEMFEDPCPERWTCHYHGIFYVSRERIRRRPRSFYRALYDRLGGENCPYFGYVLERMWAPILGGDYTIRKDLV